MIASIEKAPKGQKFFLIALLGFLAFGCTLSVGFMWDDHEMIVKNPQIQNVTPKNIATLFTEDVFQGKGDAYFRPLQAVFNALDFQIWKFNAFGFHLTNLLLHLGCALLLFALLNRLIRSPLIPFLTASFFVIHPIIIEQLLIVAGRAEIMAFFFTLAALWAVLRHTGWGYALSCVFYLMACLSKESGLIFPLYLGLIVLFRKDEKFPLPLWIGYAIIGFGYLWIRSLAVGPLATSAGPLQWFHFFIWKIQQLSWNISEFTWLLMICIPTEEWFFP